MISLNQLSQILQIDETELLKKLPQLPLKKITPVMIQDLLKNKLEKWFAPKIITIAALKGGIGKTFLSTHMAVRASMLGMKVLIIDLDPEACATNSLLDEESLGVAKLRKITMLEVLRGNDDIENAIIPTKYEFLDLIPSALKISKIEKVVGGNNPKTLLKKITENLNYDLIFFELPPSFSTLISSAYLASDTIIIPCTPNIHALESVDLTIEAVSEVATEFECHDIEFKVLMNMFNPKRNASQDVLQILNDDYPHLLLPFKIHESADVLNAINAGITIYESKSVSIIREELDQLLRHLCQLVPVDSLNQYQHPLRDSSLIENEFQFEM